MRRPTLVTAAVAAAVAVVGFSLASGQAREEAPTPTVEAASGSPLGCTFSAGARAAYRVSSRVVASQGGSDRLAGTLSWVVERGSSAGRSARLRAALTEVQLEQQLTRPADRADAARVEAGVFALEVDPQCRFTALSFDGRWDAASQHLVRSLLETVEVVVEPGAKRWTAPQQDGMGTYLASYVRRGHTVERTKDSYDDDPTARQMGLHLQVLGATLRATFDPQRRDWLRRVEGREQVALRVGGDAPERLEHRFELMRDDAAFRAVAEAGTGVPLVAEAAAARQDEVDPELAALSRQAVQARFLALFDERGRSAAFPAARLLADRLRAHPDEVWEWLDALRTGALDERSHAAFFLGLQLAGTEPSRDALAACVVDPKLSDMNRARAASALADHGTPTEFAASLLQQQVREPPSELVANASLLGLGTMAGRSEGPLRDELRAFLKGELAAASVAEATVATIDAMANSGDEGFADVLTEHLSEGAPMARAHAARALTRVAPDEAHDALLERLQAEAAPGVRLAILQSLPSAGARPFFEAERAAALRLLQSALPEERAATIDWIGKVADPETRRSLLARHFHLEHDAHLRQRIGVYVTAAELRAAAAGAD